MQYTMLLTIVILLVGIFTLLLVIILSLRTNHDKQLGFLLEMFEQSENNKNKRSKEEVRILGNLLKRGST